ncbi:extracellular solute-binding protein [Pseudonocardia spinosispora]|uniref:extracellular solute-binding protein n=1 Tax=Pseudonocardia spinosispora TaxID=103441 RepID=UPI00041C297E|nr:extracellular solute-binding protein [Pseudonocardia spinosispora]
MVVLGLSGCLALAGCGAVATGPPLLTWYTVPDNGAQATIARQCADESHGAYRVAVEMLPNDSTQQREQLVRRLAAEDSSIDVVSLDVVLTAEFANAGFLRPFTSGETASIAAGKMAAPMSTAYWKDVLYAAPLKTNTQLLWFRRSAVAAAGVDPNTPGFTWDDMLTAATGQGKRIAVQGDRYEGYLVWINALVESAGGHLVDDLAAGSAARPAVDGPAGHQAARIVGELARSSAAPANLSVAQEETGRAVFQSDQGMFMVNWPYVLTAARTAAEKGSLPRSVVDDIGWAPYPRVTADRPSKPPLGGANLAVGAYSEKAASAVALVQCATSLASTTEFMLAEGDPSPYAAAFEDPRVRALYPNADLIRDSIEAGGPRPNTPYYVEVAGSVLNTWHPPASVTDRTPASTDAFMADVLSGRRLL